jgi:activator of 2-hydroxyglutaryl-CoA dehydratase
MLFVKIENYRKKDKKSDMNLTLKNCITFVENKILTLKKKGWKKEISHMTAKYQYLKFMS